MLLSAKLTHTVQLDIHDDQHCYCVIMHYLYLLGKFYDVDVMMSQILTSSFERIGICSTIDIRHLVFQSSSRLSLGVLCVE